MTLEEAQESLRKKGYAESEIDIWTAGYNFTNTRPARDGGWTAVEDGLPEADGDYEVSTYCCTNGEKHSPYVALDSFENGAFDDIYVYAWREKPDPYKGDKMSKPTDAVGREALIDRLQYIADSPAQEHGGFHAETVQTAKDAIAYITNHGDTSAERVNVQTVLAHKAGQKSVITQIQKMLHEHGVGATFYDRLTKYIEQLEREDKQNERI